MTKEEVVRKINTGYEKAVRDATFAAPTLLDCAEFHENVGSYLLMGAMMTPIRNSTLSDMKSRSLKHYEWAKAIRKLIGNDKAG